MRMFETIKKQPEKWIYRLLLAGFLASMLPIWYLSRYAVPACDDFTYGVTTYQAWHCLLYTSDAADVSGMAGDAFGRGGAAGGAGNDG